MSERNNNENSRDDHITMKISKAVIELQKSSKESSKALIEGIKKMELRYKFPKLKQIETQARPQARPQPITPVPLKELMRRRGRR